MSRSHRAWTESCALVRAVVGGAGKLGKPEEVQVLLGHERLLGTARSFTRLRWLAAAAVLVLACGPAVSLGRASGSGQSRPAATHIPPSSPQAHAARSAAGSSRRLPARSLSARGGIAGAQLVAPGSGEHSPGGSGPVRALQRRLAEPGIRAGSGRRALWPADRAGGDAPPSCAWPAGRRDRRPARRWRRLPLRSLCCTRARDMRPGGQERCGCCSVGWPSLGFAPGPVDGRYGPRTEQAVGRFQAAHGLRVDGIADASTLARLGRTDGFPAAVRSPVASAALVAVLRAHEPAGAPVRQGGCCARGRLDGRVIARVGVARGCARARVGGDRGTARDPPTRGRRLGSIATTANRRARAGGAGERCAAARSLRRRTVTWWLRKAQQRSASPPARMRGPN